MPSAFSSPPGKIDEINANGARGLLGNLFSRFLVGSTPSADKSTDAKK